MSRAIIRFYLWVLYKFLASKQNKVSLLFIINTFGRGFSKSYSKIITHASSLAYLKDVLISLGQ